MILYAKADALGYAYCNRCSLHWEDEDRPMVLFTPDAHETCELCGCKLHDDPAPESYEGSNVEETTVARIF